MPTLKAGGPLHIIMMHDGVDLPLSGLMPQLASENDCQFETPSPSGDVEIDANDEVAE